jgi:phosphoglucomutase
MKIHPLAGKIAPTDILTNIPRLVSGYYTHQPERGNPAHHISFGTSGHRGTSLDNTFNEHHILAISQAICEFRQQEEIDGPLFLGMDTHALSEAAMVTAIEVFVANRVSLRIQKGQGYTPTPVISHAILCYNKHRKTGLADGVVITPSHNPPGDGGFKYNPATGGPADTNLTRTIQERANQILIGELNNVKRVPISKALNSDFITEIDYVQPYISDLTNIIDMDIITASGMKIGVDPLGGSGLHFWEPIADRYKLNLEVVNKRVDPTFSFMRVDKDGKIRMDCSSPYAMAGLVDLKDRFDISFGNDPDYDRHGIVTRSAGLMNPNHYLSVAVWYLFSNRPVWPHQTAVGKTLVSSSMIDRITNHLKRKIFEVPVGFKWFVDGLITGRYGFAGEESAGATFLRKDGTVWTTDKDGFVMDLLAAEITAKTGKDPAEHYRGLEKKFGSPVYERIDAPANQEQKLILKNLSPEKITAKELAGEAITEKLTKAPGNDAAIGGLKVVTENGWFAARPSGTEDIYKIYIESFKGEDHLEKIKQEAQAIVSSAFDNS